MQTIDPAKTPRILSSQQAADRMGLPVQVLYKLRDADERLSISQTGLQIGYQLEDIQAYERREMLALVEKTLAAERPLPPIRAMAQLLQQAQQRGLPRTGRADDCDDAAGWRLHDLVIWDNRCTLHRGTAFDDLRWRRDFQRATVADVANSCEQTA